MMGTGTYRYLEFFIFLVVSESVSEKIGTGKSLGTGIGKIWYRKKSTGTGIGKIWYRKKVSVPVSFKILGTVILWSVQSTPPTRSAALVSSLKQLNNCRRTLKVFEMHFVSKRKSGFI